MSKIFQAGIMRRIAVIAVIVMLAAGGLASGASAAALARAPVPKCNAWGVGPHVCSCPHGWHVKWPPWWEFWKHPVCARNH